MRGTGEKRKERCRAAIFSAEKESEETAAKWYINKGLFGMAAEKCKRLRQRQQAGLSTRPDKESPDSEESRTHEEEGGSKPHKDDQGEEARYRVRKKRAILVVCGSSLEKAKSPVFSWKKPQQANQLMERIWGISLPTTTR